MIALSKNLLWRRRFSFLEVIFALAALGMVTAATVSVVAISNMQVLNGRLRTAAEHVIQQETERWRYAPFSNLKLRGDVRESTSESGWLLRRLNDDDTVTGRFPYTLTRTFQTIDMNTVQVDIELQWLQIIAEQSTDLDDANPQKLQSNTRKVVRSRH